MTSLTKPKLAVYLVGIFIAGALSGGFVGYQFKTDRRGPPPRPSQEQWIGMIRKKFAEEVGVSDEQWQAKVGPIITNVTREIAETDSKNRERIGEMISRSDAMVMEVLTDEQKPRMQKMIDDRQKHHRRKGEKRGPKDNDDRPAGDKLVPPTNQPSAPSP